MEEVFNDTPDDRMQQIDAACRNTSQIVKLKMHPLQHLLVFQSWHNVTSNAT